MTRSTPRPGPRAPRLGLPALVLGMGVLAASVLAGGPAVAPVAAQVLELDPEEANRERFAVVIGISRYADEAIPNLAFAAEDARAFYEFLRSPAAGFDGFAEENVRLLLDADATARNVRSALTTFLRGRAASERDVLFVFIVAHGLPDPYRPEDIYMLTHDTRLADLAATGIPLADIQDAILEVQTYHTVVFADVTHAATLGGNARSRLQSNRASAEMLGEDADGPDGYVAMVASEPGQISREGEEWGGGHGVFAHYLLDGLRGAADQDRDGVVTLAEVLEYTRDRVRRATSNSQIPTISLTEYDRFWPMAAVLDP